MLVATLIASVISSSLLVSAADISVTAPSGVSFNPTSVTAAAGDNVVFTFSSLHTVTQSNFDSPCSRLSDGFDSGTKSSGTFSIQVNDTNPVWIFCAIPGHCQLGMVFAINPATSGVETFNNFQAKAEGKTITTASGSGGSTTSPPKGSSTSTSTSTSTTSKGGSSNPYPGVATSILAAGSALLATVAVIGLTSAMSV